MIGFIIVGIWAVAIVVTIIHQVDPSWHGWYRNDKGDWDIK